MTRVPEVRVAASIAPILRLGVLAVAGATVVARDARMDGPMAATEAQVRRAAERSDVVAAVRTLYKRVGLDPTKVRPSSEALLRRVRKGEALPRINSAVDVCNWCSVETQLPYGLYDLARVEGDVEARLGRTGEAYAGIRKDVVHLEDRLVLADTAGPFGNPTSDSARTMVTDATTGLLFVVFCPTPLGEAALEAALALTEERAVAFTGGRPCLRALR